MYNGPVGLLTLLTRKNIDSLTPELVLPASDGGEEGIPILYNENY